MRVLKFGGTSMVDAKSWHRVLNIIARSKKPVVVVSATDRTTRHLANAARTAVTDLKAALKIIDEISSRHKKIIIQFLAANSSDREDEIKQHCLNWIDKCSSGLSEMLKKINDEGIVSPQNNDAVLSTGEQLSARLFAQCGQAFGLKTDWINARSVIKTDGSFGKARPDFEKIENNIGQVTEKVNQNIIPVIGGFYGENEKGQITTLGFEGSDYSAALIGAAVNADDIEIWTDVSGIFTCDPRVISSAKPIDHLSFNDAEQLANHGAKVLHPASVHPAASKNIPVLVKNIFMPRHKGTTVRNVSGKSGLCKALAFVKNVSALKINTASQNIREHRLVNVFAILENFEAATIAIKTGKKSTLVVLNDIKQATRLREKLSPITAVSEIENQGLIGLIGCAPSDAQLSEQVTNALQPKKTVLIGNDQTGVLSLLVDKSDLLDSVKVLHRTLFE